MRDGNDGGRLLPMDRDADETLAAQERAEITLDSIGDAVVSTDTSGNVTYLNAFAERMTGWRREEAVGRPLVRVVRIVDRATREASPNPMDLAVRMNTTVGLTSNCVLIRRDGFETPIEDSAAPIHDRQGRIAGAVMVLHDVSAARATSLHMSHLAAHDALTDLPNRMLLNDRLTQAIESARRHRYQLAVVFLDLDRFKQVNDSVGHGIGDQLLQTVASRLVASVRRSDTVSRYGGDEFVILLSRVEQADDAAAAARKVITALTMPIEVTGHELHVSVSIGVSVYPDDGQDSETLIENADTAMYSAKARGSNLYQFFKPEMHVRALTRHWMESDLRHALGRQEFVLCYQPKISLETGAMTGAEAVVHWMHPARGLTLPEEFLPIAEGSNLVVPIGRWALREACGQARACLDAGRPTRVAHNLSASEFRDRELLAYVSTALTESRLEPRYLELELTESVLMQHTESTTRALQALRHMGVQIAVDDFGTGYSSLRYLRDCPVDSLKIDRSFVREITADAGAVSIVSAAIGIGKSLKCRVVAQGVETAQQVAVLRAMGCDEGQGDYLARPLVAEEFARLVARGGRGEVEPAAEAPDRLAELPYDTIVGERGVHLSAGQRVAIGRATHHSRTVQLK
jgi:diguanylate cyclase (GGDEF)-like protein/PAS domain S-box-containing protein